MLSRLFKEPAAFSVAPSSAGLASFRMLQEKSLKAFDQEALLTDYARRVRNRLVVTATAAVIAVTAATWGATSSAPALAIPGESAELRAANDAHVERAVLSLEKAATDLFVLKVSGAPAAQQAASRAVVFQSAGGVYAELKAALVVGNDAAIEMARIRIGEMNKSDLGKLGINFVAEAIPKDESILYADASKKTRSVTPGM